MNSKYNSRQEEGMADTQLELPSEGGFTDRNPDNSYSSGAEQEINSTEINTVNTCGSAGLNKHFAWLLGGLS